MGKTLNPIRVHHGCYNAQKFEYKWTIPNFKKLATKNAVGSSTASEYVYCNLEDKNNSFYLILYPHGYNERAKNYLSVYLKRYESHEILIQFTCELLDSKSEQINVKYIKQKMSIESHLGWISYCRRDFLLDDENTILTDGNLTLNCTIEIFENKAIMNAETEDDDPYMNKSLSKLSTDMNRLLLEGDSSEVTLKAEDQDFPVHKAILSARSAVFKRMLKSRLQANSKEINISDIKGETIKKMLHYIYSCDVENIDVQTTQELYYAADKYELYDLKMICIKILAGNLDIQNAIDILLLGYRHSDQDLKYASIEYIAKNLSEIQEKQEWILLMKNYPKLANMVLKYHLKIPLM